MQSTSGQKYFAILVFLLVLIIVTPYVIAWRAEGKDYVFGGFLVNPIDGNSYLAKMYQGWEGSWKFRLPYTAEAGDGAYLFLFYLFLGHLARLADLPLILVFHIVRIMGTVFLAYTLWIFFGRMFERPPDRRLAFVLVIFGAGLGWIASVFGAFTSDLWVAEAFPFLSSFANPHFPVGLALLVSLLTPRPNQNSPIFDLGATIIQAILLAIIMPFGVVLAGLVTGGLLVWEILEHTFRRADALLPRPRDINSQIYRSRMAKLLAGLFIGGAPFVFYDIWVSSTDPVFAGWNQQNLTPSPPAWDLLASLGLVFVFAIPGLIHMRRERFSDRRVLLAWAALGLGLMYAPVGLQRRFMLGMFIPFVGLAVMGMRALSGDSKKWRLLVASLLLIASIPTNVMVILATVHGSTTHEPKLFLSIYEAQALDWLKSNTESEALILASPEIGMFLPAQTGRRVFYGHPFETVNAIQMRSQVELTFQTTNPWDSQLLQKSDFILFGPREHDLGDDHFFGHLPVVFEAGNVRVYLADPALANR